MHSKKKKIKWLVIFSVLVILVYFVYWFFFSMAISRLPKGRFLYEEASPKGTYTLKVYVSEPALSADAVRVELIMNNKKGKKKNLYWEYRESTAMITWIDDDTVKINDHELNLPNDQYDWRKDKEWDVKHGY